MSRQGCQDPCQQGREQREVIHGIPPLCYNFKVSANQNWVSCMEPRCCLPTVNLEDYAKAKVSHLGGA